MVVLMARNHCSLDRSMKDTTIGLVICYLLHHKLGTQILGGGHQIATEESGNERNVVSYLLRENFLPRQQHESYDTQQILYYSFPTWFYNMSRLANCVQLDFSSDHRSNLGLVTQTNP